MKAKCLTDVVMASDLGVDGGSFNGKVGNIAHRRKRIIDQATPQTSKRNKATSASSPSSVGSVSSDFGSHFSSALSLAETNAEASPSSPE